MFILSVGSQGIDSRCLWEPFKKRVPRKLRYLKCIAGNSRNRIQTYSAAFPISGTKMNVGIIFYSIINQSIDHWYLNVTRKQINRKHLIWFMRTWLLLAVTSAPIFFDRLQTRGINKWPSRPEVNWRGFNEAHPEHEKEIQTEAGAGFWQN